MYHQRNDITPNPSPRDEGLNYHIANVFPLLTSGEGGQGDEVEV